MKMKVGAIQTVINILQCISIKQFQQATSQDDHLQLLKGYIIIGWPENKDQIPQDMRTYWTFLDDMAVIDGFIMKGRYVVIPEVFEKTDIRLTPSEPHGNRKTKLLAWESVYWININDDIEKHIKSCITCLTFQQTQPKDKIIQHDILANHGR